MPQAGGTRVRATRQVAAVIAVMSGMRAFCGARDIYDVLRRCGHHVGLATVYRHLHVLAERGEAGAIYTASGESRYRLRASSATCHLICRACGCTVAVDGSEILHWDKRRMPGRSKRRVQLVSRASGAASCRIEARASRCWVALFITGGLCPAGAPTASRP